jgi:hypothetical protein
MARAAPICRRLTLFASLARSHGDPCINVLLGISAEALWGKNGGGNGHGEFGIEAAFIVAPGTPPQ